MNLYGMPHLKIRKTKHKRLLTPFVMRLSEEITKESEPISVMESQMLSKISSGTRYIKLQVILAQDLQSS